jgi:pimeloyl-ACP methyl ester carboxylesterase
MRFATLASLTRFSAATSRRRCHEVSRKFRTDPPTGSHAHPAPGHPSAAPSVKFLLRTYLALAAPERIRRLALLAPAATLAPLAAAFTLRSLPQVVWPSRAAFAGLMRWMAVAPSEGREGYEALVEGCIELIYTGRHRDGFRMVPMWRVLRDEELQRLAMPTLVMIGADEKIYNAAAALSRAEALIPGVKAVRIPDASHDLMFAQPALVNANLREFLAPAS